MLCFHFDSHIFFFQVIYYGLINNPHELAPVATLKFSLNGSGSNLSLSVLSRSIQVKTLTVELISRSLSSHTESSRNEKNKIRTNK
jgi:hypothetical protein